MQLNINSDDPSRGRPTERDARASHVPTTRRGVVRLNRALEPASRAARCWRSATRDLMQLDRRYQRDRAHILQRRRRATEHLAAFMAKTGVDARWLRAQLALPDEATTEQPTPGDST